jgi:hypothetical protein
MPTLRLRKLLLDRLSNDLRAAGELGLAFLMTAGVASCGGTEIADKDGGGDGEVSDGAADHQQFVEAAECDGGCVGEAAQEGGQDFDVVVTESVGHDAGPDGEAFEAAMFEGGKH